MSETWPPWVARGVVEVETRFSLKGGTYRGHADGDPGHDMSGDRAADFWTTNKAVHDRVLSWFVGNNFSNARRLGMTYIISWRRIASVGRASDGIRAYTRYGPDAGASQAHTNHVHISWGNTPPAQQEDDLPTPEDVWNCDIVDDVWHPDDKNARVLAKTALKEIGLDGNRIEVVVKQNRAEIAELKKMLAAILAKLP